MGNSWFALILSIGFLISVWLIVHVAARRHYGIQLRNTFRRVSLATALVLLGWFSLVAVLGRGGFFAATPLIAPNIIFAFFFFFIVSRKIYHSATLRIIFNAIPPQWLIALHLWRIGGVWFISLYFAGILPAEFAFPSGIGDVLVGITAPLMAYLFLTKKDYVRHLVIGWNYVGVADLLMAVLLGNVAYPDPFPPLIDGQILSTSVSTGPLALYPLVLIPLFAIPLSLLMHAFSLRMLKSESLTHLQK